MSSSNQKLNEVYGGPVPAEMGSFTFVRHDIAIRKMLKEGKAETTIFKVNYGKHTNFAPEVIQISQ